MSVIILGGNECMERQYKDLFTFLWYGTFKSKDCYLGIFSTLQ